jgi:hypothetical protein
MILKLAILLLLLVVVFGMNEYEAVEGLCITSQLNNCPDIVQLFGMCCRPSLNSGLLYYKNSCLACASVTLNLIRIAIATTTKLLIPRIAAINPLAENDSMSIFIMQVNSLIK